MSDVKKETWKVRMRDGSWRDFVCGSVNLPSGGSIAFYNEYGKGAPFDVIIIAAGEWVEAEKVPSGKEEKK